MRCTRSRSEVCLPPWAPEMPGSHREEELPPTVKSFVADGGPSSYLAGVSTRRMEKLVKTLGIDSLSMPALMGRSFSCRRALPGTTRASQP